MQPYGEEHQRQRKLTIQCLGLEQHKVYLDDMRRTVLMTLLELMEQPRGEMKKEFTKLYDFSYFISGANT